MNRIALILGSVLAGLLLGLAIRRARMPAPLTSVDARAQLPSRERIDASLIRAEIRDLDARLAALREEGDAVDRERTLLAALSEPPAPPSIESTLRSHLRALLADHQLTLQRRTLNWLREDPQRIAVLLKIAAEVYREKDWGRHAHSRVSEYLSYSVSNSPEVQEKLLSFLLEAQRGEHDLLIRGWMLGLLDDYKIGLPSEQLAELTRTFQECKDPRFRESAFPLILKEAGANADLIRDAIRQGPDLDERSRHLLTAWSRRALPGGELRKMATELMRSENPGTLIMEAQDWVPKYINPLAPQETIALFDQTLSKPIAPMHKAISVMVMGSIATLFPSHPGRAEIERLVTTTDDAKLKEFASKVGTLIDEGKGYAEIRQLNPREFGLELPK